MGKGDKLLVSMRQFLASDDQTDRPEMREAAQFYSEACEAANDVLDDCATMLGKGLVSEAINKAQSLDPPLLIRLGKINFDKRGEWLEFCRDYGWPEPPELNLAAAAMLEDAYKNAASLRPLLDQWRAIVRTGSTQGKLALARRIVAVDPGNEAWRKNVFELERDYLSELVEDAKEAIENNQPEILKDIHHEMFGTGMTIRPDERVVNKIDTILAEYHAKCLRADADRLLAKINDAYGNFDHAALPGLLGQWDRICSDAAFAPTAVDGQWVSDARVFLQGKQAEIERDSKIAELTSALTNALDQQAPITEIEKIYYHLRESGADVPQLLESRVRSVREEWDLEQARKHRNRLVFSVVGSLLIAGTLFIGTWQYREIKAKNLVLAKSSEALVDDRPALALKLMEDYLDKNPKKEKDPDIKVALEKAQKGVESRERLDAEFDTKAASFQADLAIEDNTDRTDGLKGRLENLRQVADRHKLEHQDTLAKSEGGLKIYKTRWQVRYNAQFKIEYDKLVAAVDGFESIRAAGGITLEIAGKLDEDLRSLSEMLESLRMMDKTEADIRVKESLMRLEGNRDWLRKAAFVSQFEDKLAKFTSLGEFAALASGYLEACKQLPGKTPKFTEAINWLDAYDGVVVGELFRIGDIDFSKGFPHDLEMLLKERPAANFVWHRDLVALQKAADSIKPVPSEFLATVLKQAIDDLSKQRDSYQGWYELRFKEANRYYWMYTRTQSVAHPKLSRINREVVSMEAEFTSFYPILEGGTVPFDMKLKYTANHDKKERKIEITPGRAQGAISNRDMRFFELVSNFKPDNINFEQDGAVIMPEALHYAEMVALVNRLTAAETASTERLLSSAIACIDNLLAVDNMHPLPRLRAAIRLAQLISEISPPHAERLSAAIERLRRSIDGLVDDEWVKPVPPTSAEYLDQIAGRMAIANRELGYLGKIGTDSDSKAQSEIDLLVAAMSRRLRAVGVVEEGVDDQRQGVRLFFPEASSKPKELWLLRSGEDGLEFVVVAEEAAGNYRFDPGFVKDYFEGQALFSPGDGLSTRELASRLAAKHRSKGGEIAWPKSWPKNRRVN